jgi:hypothetical protein
MPTVRAEDFNLITPGNSTRQLIRMVQRALKVKKFDFEEYERDEITTAINTGMEAFAAFTGCLRTLALIRPAASQQNYRLPFGIKRVTAGKYFTGDSLTAYKELEVLEDVRRMAQIDREYRGQTGQPVYVFPAYKNAEFLTLGFSPIPTSNGSEYTPGDDSLVSSTLDLGSMASITGTHIASGYDNSDYLVDNAGRNLGNLGGIPGYPVYNTTRNAGAIIRTVGDAEATNDKVTADLPKQTKWVAGDSFRIPLTEYGLFLDAVNKTNSVISSAASELSNLTPLTGNILLDLVRRPLPLSPNITLEDQICEIPIEYQAAVVSYAVHALTGDGDAYQFFMNAVTGYEVHGKPVEPTTMAVSDVMSQHLQ